MPRPKSAIPRSFEDLDRKDQIIIDALIDEARRKRREELEERLKNPNFIFRDDPKPTLSRWFEETNGFLGDNKELVQIWKCGRHPQRTMKDVVLTKGQTTYKASWLTWPAFQEVVVLLKSRGITDRQTIYDIVTAKFPFIYGVVTVVRRWNPSHSKSWIFCGIRSDNLAGANTGKVSYPAGLVNVGERVGPAGLRELFEEGPEGKVNVRPGFVVGYHDNAPSCSFVSLAETEADDVRDNFEWKGGKGIWVPETSVIEALYGFTAPMMETFAAHGIKTQFLQFAPDVLEPAKELLIRIYPSKNIQFPH